MARKYARLQVAIWSDEDFRDQPPNAQHAYITLLSQPRLSYCGVLDYIPSRVAAVSKGNTAAKVEGAVRTLERGRFVCVDRETHELLIRTYVRHDGVLERANMGKAMGRALANVVSESLRQSVMDELARQYRDDPTMLGWGGFAEEFEDAFETVTVMASRMPLRMASGMG